MVSLAARQHVVLPGEGCTVTTGPKISSRTTFHAGFGVHQHVGPRKWPGPSIFRPRSAPSLGEPGHHVVPHPVKLLPGDQRTHLGIHARSDLHQPRPLGDAPGHLVEGALFDV